MSKFLYEWDSVNYALGFERYDILSHQPHFPGYIFYIGLGKLVNSIFNDANTTMIVISISFSILTVILVYYLAKNIFSRKIGIISSILLIFNPLFWFYGEIATIYPSHAFFASLIAFVSYQVLRGNEKFFYLSAVTLGLAGGFRQDLIIFMFRKKFQIKILLNAKFVFLSLWIFPMIIFQFMVHSPKPGYILVYISAISMILGYIFNYFSLKIENKHEFSYKSVLSSLLTIFIFLNSLYFIYPSNINYESTWETPLGFIDENQKILLCIDLLFVYRYEKIYKNDLNTEYHINMIMNNSNPEKTIIIIRDILREDQGFSWRKAIYYLPQYNIYSISDDENSQLKTSKTNKNFIVFHGKNHKGSGFENKTLEIPLNTSTTQIIWVMNNKTKFFKNVNSKLNTTFIILPNGLKIYYSDIDGAKSKSLSFLT